MCGIVGATAQRDITPILLEGLQRLEYRGYDSAGVAVVDSAGAIQRIRAVGKVVELENALQAKPVSGHLGIAHTRWATHGKPAEHNAHPHLSNGLAIVHNGIIENHAPLRKQLQDLGYSFTSETDTEVVAHLLAHHFAETGDMLSAFRSTLGEIHGAYALAVIHDSEPGTLYCSRMGSPLVIGEGSGEHYLASDPLALLQVTDRFRYLEEGDYARITLTNCEIWDRAGNSADRPVVRYEHAAHSLDKGEYRHFMLKEIHEQPKVVQRTLEGRLGSDHVLVQAFGPQAAELFAKVKNVQIVACGTSFHAGMVARYWLEELAGIPCQVEVASEFRYRDPVLDSHTLVVAISQSGAGEDINAVVEASAASGALTGRRPTGSSPRPRVSAR